MIKKILIISYYWPPSGGSGVQRWLKFAKYLPKYNWRPIIYTPQNPYIELKDIDLEKDVSDSLDVVKTTIWEPYAFRDKLFGKSRRSQASGIISTKKTFKNRLLNWIRGNFFIPDPRIFWVKPSIKTLLKKIKGEGIEYLITTGPPHSMHLIGLGIKKTIPNLKWVADFRDPWSKLDSLEEFELSNYSRNKHKKLEKEVLKTADVVLTVSENWQKEFKNLGANRVELITNGYDTDDFKIKSISTDKFIVGHYGLLNHLRNPDKLWEALNALCDKNTDFNNKLEIHLSGNIAKDVIVKIKSYDHLKDKVKQLGYLSHQQVLEEYNKVSILLLLLFNSNSGLGNYPGKMFEYFAAQKPILAFGPQGSDVEKLFRKLNTGTYYSYEDSVLESNIMNVFNNHNISSIIKDKQLECFSRENLTYDLSNLLNTLS